MSLIRGFLSPFISVLILSCTPINTNLRKVNRHRGVPTYLQTLYIYMGLFVRVCARVWVCVRVCMGMYMGCARVKFIALVFLSAHAYINKYKV